MAEGFARHLGAGRLEASSAGLFPARIIQPETYQAMEEKGVPLERRPPRHIVQVDAAAVDLLVNMAGPPVAPLLRGFRGSEVTWPIRDPIGQSFEIYRSVRDHIEQRVADLVEQLATR